MNLLQLQRTMARDIMRPPRTGGACARTADWLKPNDRLSARARLNIYHRQYWRRLLECLAEDFPALRALVGDRAFQRISGAYLTDCPSRSFTLRDLGSGLQAWLQAHPGCCGSLRGRALDAPADDIAALEWAEVEAFDSAVHREIGPEHFAELDPNLRIGLQPYIRLLKLSYPADEMRSSLLASTSQRRRALISRIDSANAEGIFLAVYRSEDEVCCRRLEPAEFVALRCFARGGPLTKLLAKSLRGSPVPPEEFRLNIARYLASWTESGWVTVL